MTLCFPDEINEHETFAKIEDIVDGAVPRDEYVDEMLVMSLIQIKEIAPPELASPFDLFGVSVLEIVEKIQFAPAPKIIEDVMVVDGLFDGPVGLVEGASDLVDPPLSFDVLSGFVSRHDYVSDFSSMDLSIFEYLPISHVIDYLHHLHPHHRFLTLMMRLRSMIQTMTCLLFPIWIPLMREFHLL